MNNEPEELKAILAGATAEVKSFILKQTKAHDEMADQVKELKTRTLELEQKGVRNPRSEGGGGGPGELTDLIFKSDGLAAFTKGASPSVQIQVPSRLLKANILNVNPLTNDQPLVQADRIGGINYAPQTPMNVMSIFQVIPTNSNLVEFSSELAFTSNAGPQGGTTSPDEATEGETKPESAMTFQLSQSPVITVAHFIPASRQILSDAPMLQAHLEGRLLYGLAREVQDELINGAGLQGELQGLIANSTAFNGGATNQTFLDTVAKGLQQLIAGEYQPTHIILNSADWLSTQLLKDTTGRYLFADPQQATAPRLFGTQVVIANQMPAGSFLVLDAPRAAFVAMREEAHVRIAEQHSDFFTKNLVAVLAELRVALCITNSAAIIYGSTSFAG